MIDKEIHGAIDRTKSDEQGNRKNDRTDGTIDRILERQIERWSGRTIDRQTERQIDIQTDRQMSLWRENYIDAVPKFKSVTQPGAIKSIQKYISTTVMTYRQPSLQKIQILKIKR